MSKKPPSRDLIKIVFTNFINSFKPRQFRGNLVGEDHFGNKFFEIPPNPKVGKRKASRWFEPKDKEDFEQEMPAEWDAWLRGRRPIPPTTEEVMKNHALIQMKKRNAQAIDDKFSDKTKLQQKVTGLGSYPDYGNEYETMPGKEKK